MMRSTSVLVLLLFAVATCQAGQVPTQLGSAAPSSPVPSGAAVIQVEHDEHAGHDHGQPGAEVIPPDERPFIERLEKIRSNQPKDEADDERIRAEYTGVIKEFAGKFPDSPRLLIAISSLVSSLTMSGKGAEAEKLGQDLAAAAKTPNGIIRTTKLLIDIYVATQQTSKAIDLLRKSLERKEFKPLEWLMRVQLASLLQQDEKYDESIAVLQAFIEANPIHPRVGKIELKLCETMIAADRTKDAIARLESFQKGVISDEDKAGSAYFLGMAHLTLARHATDAADAEKERKAALKSLEVLLQSARKGPPKDPAAERQDFGPEAFLATSEIALSAGDKEGAKRSLEEMAKLYKGKPAGSYAERVVKQLDWIGRSAPDFSGPSPDGKTVSLKDFAGKLVLLDFWATWCGPCRVELPNVRKLAAATTGKPFAIVSISLDKPEAKETLDKFIVENRMAWAHIYDGKAWESPICKSYEVTGIPATFLIHPNGKVLRIGLRGPQLKDVVASELRRLESKAPASPRPSPAPSAAR